MSKRKGLRAKSSLRDLRLAQGQTLEEVARATGTTRAHISAIETGRIQNPSLRILLALATHFGCSLDNLVGHTHGIGLSRQRDPVDQLFLSELEHLQPDKKRALLRFVRELISDSNSRESPTRRFA